MDDEDTNEEELPSQAEGQQGGAQNEGQEAPESGGGGKQGAAEAPQAGAGASQPSTGGSPSGAGGQQLSAGGQQPGGNTNFSMPGSGQGSGLGSGQSPASAGAMTGGGGQSAAATLGAASRSLAQPFPQFSPAQLQQFAAQNRQGGGPGSFGSRPGRIDARPRNNIYMPGTGPGTGRTAIRVGTLNRDGSASPVSGMGSATGPLSQPQSRLFEQRQPTSDYAQQRQANVANAKADGSFDGIRDKFNSSNAGHYMDESGTISQRGADGKPGAGTSLLFQARQPGGGASGAGQFVSAPDGQGGSKMVRLPDKPAAAAKPAGAAPAPPAAAAPPTPPRPPLAAAGNAPKTSFMDGLLKGVPGAAKPAGPKPPLAAAGGAPPKAPAAGAPLPPLTGNLLKGVMSTTTPKPPLAGAANVAPKPPLAAAGNPTPPAAAPRSASKATFEGQSREEFFAAAAQRQKMDNKYAKWKGQ